ncbi:(Fe-S)-binding protein [Acidianus sp. HS-5]|uniref:(Fe-S)-binding protein n=1 Tax=Acidianus sp. HS-5 TaxID=2886040 RepID=UPI001F3E4CA1|nr:(Fe-S)-binding protein [Acidianus sp. HS-5]
MGLEKCVHCGFCLESCPTYVITRSEIHSPRGRILAVKLGIPSEGLETCVFCRRCEASCPSGVEYGDAISSVRKADPLRKAVHKILENPSLLYASLKIARYSTSGFMYRLSRFIPEVNPPLSISSKDAQLILFPGCITSVVFRKTVEKAYNYLSKYFKVSIYNGCCGLPHYAEGDKERAIKIAEKLKDEFKGKVVVSLSSNCTAHMKEMGIDVYDFSEFLAKRDLPLPKIDMEVTVHDPCHANLVGITKYNREVLKKMGVKIREMEDPSFECGAGGSYFVFQADLSDKIMKAKEEKVKKSGANVVVSTNPSCSLAIMKYSRVVHIADLL